MEPDIRQDLIAITQEAIQAIQKRRYFELRGISDHIIHSISIHQESYLADCAIAIYALSKIFDKEQYLEHRGIDIFIQKVLSSLNLAQSAAKKSDIQLFTKATADILKTIQTLDQKVKLFERPILEYARLQKASKLIHHGLSVGKAAEIMNVPAWSLSEYLGNTQTLEFQAAESITNKKRIRYAEDLFK